MCYEGKKQKLGNREKTILSERQSCKSHGAWPKRNAMATGLSATSPSAHKSQPHFGLFASIPCPLRNLIVHHTIQVLLRLKNQPF